MKKLEEFLKKKVNSAIDKDEDSWPPVCLGIFHQPERPIRIVKSHKDKTHDREEMS